MNIFSCIIVTGEGKFFKSINETVSKPFSDNKVLGCIMSEGGPKIHLRSENLCVYL
jgi:hypothetical protein